MSAAARLAPGPPLPSQSPPENDDGRQELQTAQAAIRKSTRAGSAIRRDSGARRRTPSTGSRSRRRCSIPTPASMAAGFPMASATPATTRSTATSRPAAARRPRSSTTCRSPAPSRPSPTPRCRPRPRRWPASSSTTSASTKGDRVILYMPMVPEALVGMLACARLGAVHSVVFGGFAPKELATRIDDAKPKVILSASCGIEAARVVAYKPLLDAAIDLAKHKPDGCMILQRPQLTCELTPGRDHDWQETWDKALVWAWNVLEPVPVKATDPLYILYTSGTTGIPKGVVRDNGGHMVALQWSMQISLRRQSRRDVVVRLRHRLGGRPQLHRLCAAAARLHVDPLRGQAGRHARRRRLLARHLRVRRGRRSSRRRPRSAPSRRKTPRASISRNTICRNSARCSSPASAPIPTPCNGPSGC